MSYFVRELENKIKRISSLIVRRWLVVKGKNWFRLGDDKKGILRTKLFFHNIVPETTKGIFILLGQFCEVFIVILLYYQILDTLYMLAGWKNHRQLSVWQSVQGPKSRCFFTRRALQNLIQILESHRLVDLFYWKNKIDQQNFVIFLCQQKWILSFGDSICARVKSWVTIFYLKFSFEMFLLTRKQTEFRESSSS